MNEFDESVMRLAIRQVEDLFGREALADADRFRGAMMDFMRGNEHVRERSMLIFAVNLGVCDRLLQGRRWTAEEYRALNTAIHRQLLEDYGFSAEKGRRICEQILAAFYAALCGGCPAHKRMRFGPYTWRILHEAGDRVLLMTDAITDVGIPYHDACENITWGNSSLRRWLNSVFYERFSAKQRQRILSVPTPAEANAWYGTGAGASVEDSVSVLSVSEVVRYFGDSGNLTNRPVNQWPDALCGQSCAIDDAFNEARRAAYRGRKTWWWLRSPGASASKAAYVNTDGIIFLDGEIVFENGGTSCAAIRPGIRPAVWIRR